MKINALLYLENGITDSGLSLNDISAPDFLSESLKQIGEVSGIFFSIPGTYSGGLTGNKSALTRDGIDDINFWKQIFEKTGSDHIIKIYCDSPFLDVQVIKEMLDVHIKYLAEFTYSENLPQGMSCEILSRELIASMPDIQEKTLPVSSVIRSNINQFDIELFYKEPDIRDKRLSFRSGNPRDRKIMKNILEYHGKQPEYREIKELINNNPGILYIGPSYLEVELTGQCDLDCLFCYRKTLDKKHGNMSIDNYKKILSDMRTFELPYSLCCGGSGEPLMHDKIYEIFELSLREDLLEGLIIESNGLYADENFKNFLLREDASRVKVIFNINGLDAESYRSLHGTDSFERVFNNAVSIIEALGNNEKVFIQIMKINETEGFLDKYYDFWEKYRVPIILQKQNTYLGRITDRRYSDLSPIERTPCWHLQRDLFILSDGSAGFCKQDVDGIHTKGNINEKSIKEIWEAGKEDFARDYRTDYVTSPDCASCDEWYTFNL